jgi:soluble lytic murein transglycosylase
MSRRKKRKRKTAVIVLISVLFMALAVAGALYAMHAARLAAYPLKYKDNVTAMAGKYNLPESLVLGVIRTESSFGSTAVSPDGAVGLMQLMPETAKWIAEKMNWNSFDLYTRIPATIQSSNKIAEIGALLERGAPQSYDYRLFI